MSIGGVLEVKGSEITLTAWRKTYAVTNDNEERFSTFLRDGASGSLFVNIEPSAFGDTPNAASSNNLTAIAVSKIHPHGEEV